MSDFSKMFEGFLKQGQEMAEKMGKEFAHNQAEWMEQIKSNLPDGVAEQFENVVGDGITVKTRSLTTIAGLTARGAEDTAALTAALHAAKSAGASNREITETIMQMTAIGAVTGVQKAMMTAMTVFASDGGSA